MSDPVDTYLAVLLIGIALTIIVGQILIRSARPLLQDAFKKPESAVSVTRLLVVLFHLVVLGVIALVATIDITLDHPIQTMVVRLGLVLLVLGAAYGSTLLLLTRLRERRRIQMSIDDQAEQARQHQAAQQYGDPQDGVDPHGFSGAEVHPVSEPGPGR